MQPKDNLELLPEPEEPRMLTTIDSDAPGYPGEAYGITDEEAKELRWPATPLSKILWPWGAITFAVGTVFLLVVMPYINAYLAPVLPESEWAYESTGIRELQDSGLTGEGVHVCIVDTGIDLEHPDFENLSLSGFRDFYEGQHDDIRDIGEEFHGTMMAGLLVADGKYYGAAPGVDLSIALALSPAGTSGQGDGVAQAIRWCRIAQGVDIISLSLGSDPGSGMGIQSETVMAVQEALDAGIFVVAAAGNTGDDDSIRDVSTPANLEGVIAVGASSRNGNTWSASAEGSPLDPYTGENRSYPNQKPEVSAPGVLLFSTTSTEVSPPYAYSSGTSDSTVLVTGALALILELHGEALAGDDGTLDSTEMAIVKRTLASSCDKQATGGSPHDPNGGYGLLDAVQWASEIAFELNLDV